MAVENLDVYLVGGAVRDELLAREVKEQDFVVVGSTPQEMLARGFQQVGKDFPVFLHPQTKDEHALARTERKKGKGYTGFECYAEPDVTLEQDLIRRDLTVNAMAKSHDGKIIDPYGGLDDLNNKILRHVSDAFSEDPLRVLRVARFAARYHYLGFKVADETKQLMAKISHSGELSSISPERIWLEMSKALSEKNPEVFFEVLRETQALKQIWPDLDKLWGIPNPAKWHPEICSGVHTMMVLQQASQLTDDIAVRFAALCHDLGKTITPSDKWPSHHGHEGLGVPLVEDICNKLRVPKKTTQLAIAVCRFHLHCHKAFELRPDTILKVFNQLDVWRNETLLFDFLIACKADFRGRTGSEQADYPQKVYFERCYQAAKTVTAQAFVAQGLKGKDIKKAINEKRTEVISEVKQANS